MVRVPGQLRAERVLDVHVAVRRHGRLELLQRAGVLYPSETLVVALLNPGRQVGRQPRQLRVHAVRRRRRRRARGAGGVGGGGEGGGYCTSRSLSSSIIISGRSTFSSTPSSPGDPVPSVGLQLNEHCHRHRLHANVHVSTHVRRFRKSLHVGR